MKQLFSIFSWEFTRHFKSRSFFLATFVSPLIFSVILFIPSLFLNGSSNKNQIIISCVEFDTTRIAEKIINRFQEYKERNTPESLIFLKTFIPDTSSAIKSRFAKQKSLKIQSDSLNDAYIQIKERRKYVFQKPKTPGREALLKQTYEELIGTRESKELTLLEYQLFKLENDSLWRAEVIRKADEMLFKNEVTGYLLLDSENFSDGVVEFHSFLPSNFLQIEPLKQAVQTVIVEEKLKQENIRVGKIRDWLKPIDFKEIHLQGETKQEFDFTINYLGPIVVVLFLFISIFSSSGFLFSGIIREKTNRVIELLLSSVSHTMLIAGKIIGLGLLGIFQILIWYGILLFMTLLDIINVGEIGFVTIKNAGLFLLYFVLGYIFFASLFVGLGSLLSHEEDAHHLNQFMRMLSIFPIILAMFVLESPNSLLVKILSFIPPLTPTFMILRIPLGNPPAMDHYIAIGIMIVSICISVLFAGRLFKIGSLFYGKKVSLRAIFKSAI